MITDKACWLCGGESEEENPLIADPAAPEELIHEKCIVILAGAMRESLAENG